MKTYTKVFPNGVRLVFEKVEVNRPATVLIGVDTGSCNENEKNSGISHLIEHMSFKGTSKRNAKQINIEFENFGATANAFTSKFSTCYFATTLNESVEKCIELLGDIVFNSVYDEDELEKEKSVIFEEINMYEDLPDQIVLEEYSRLFYTNTPLERKISGTKDSLKNITRNDILDYFNKFYVGSNIIVSIVANLKFSEVVDLVKKYICCHFKKKATVVEKNKSLVIVPDSQFSFLKREVAQTQVMFGFPADNIFSSDLTTYHLFAFIFGGGMGSRLFQKVREEHGLVYSISCFPFLHPLGGDVSISFATNEKNVKKALETIKFEIDNLVQNGFSNEELDRAKIFWKSLVISSNEQGANFANSNFKSLLYFNKLISTSQRLAQIDSVSLDDLNRVARKVFNYCNMCGCLLSNQPDQSVFDIFK